MPFFLGSSPLARGLHVPELLGSTGPGIIPARAGFTRLRTPRPPSSRDHPRSRGVYSATRYRRSAWSGSSPLARGLRVFGGGCLRVGGIIPARAGFTSPSATTVPVGEDHPRSRGVYSSGGCSISATPGSSPLARGLQIVSEDSLADDRIIPARAGFTQNEFGRPSSAPDHPRSRGVYGTRYVSVLSGPGSSPLARGLRNGASDGWPFTRIIPARAGFTLRTAYRQGVM